MHFWSASDWMEAHHIWPGYNLAAPGDTSKYI